MVDRGILSPQDAIGHPMGHILSRAVGVRDEVEVDQVTGEVLPGDVCCSAATASTAMSTSRRSPACSRAARRSGRPNSWST